MYKKLPLYLLALCSSLANISCSSGSSSSSSSSSPYMTLNYSDAATNSSTLITGIRGVAQSSDVYISGIYESTNSTSAQEGLLYVGSISGVGTWHLLQYPSSSGITVSSTAFYGPNNGNESDTIQLVGNYTTIETESSALGLLYQGPVDGSGTWATLTPPVESGDTLLNTIAHSTMGGIIVGNYDTALHSGKAFIYDITNESYYDIEKPGAVSITAYGIWYNGGNSYTITGGYSDLDQLGVDEGYIADWNSDTHEISNWRSYNYKDEPITSTISHFEGITSDGNGGYNLVSDWTDVDESSNNGAAFVNVTRDNSGQFGNALWIDYRYPGSEITSANTVYQTYVLGVYTESGSDVTNSYVVNILDLY